MNDQKYNGWTNYATWRVNLEVFDGMDVVEQFGDANGHLDVRELAHNLEAFADEMIVGDARNLMGDYARAFLSEVNWQEIARHILDEIALDNFQMPSWMAGSQKA